MAGSVSCALDRLDRKPLAACAAVLFGLAAPSIGLAANTWIVNTCDQGTFGDLPTRTGSLRFAVENAASGDTVDMSTLLCSTISLSAGSIKIGQNDLTLVGPGQDNLTIRGKFTQNSNTYSDKDRIIRHSGTGTLLIYGLSMSAGDLSNATGYAKGGCLYSKGSVYLYDVASRQCSAKTDSGNARGGAIYTVGDLTAYFSIIAANSAASGSTGNAVGGGAFCKGAFASKYSTFDGNTARGPAGQAIGVAGGVFAGGDATLLASTISRNSAARNAGGIDLFNANPQTHVATLTDSTISGNNAGYLVGGLYANAGHITIANSTIAFNTAIAKSRGYSSIYFAAGATLSAHYGSIVADLQSTLIANNTVKNREWDLTTPYANPPGTTVTFNAAPGNDLVRFADSATTSQLPADTISACPLLGTLRDNGGLTATHALLSTSAAIDAGSDDGLSYDQRGSPYARASGAFADIGAYEVQQDDIVFNAGFDGCPTLP